MAGDVKGDLQAYDDINVTPMLDLAYVLLVVFIIMTTASVQGVKVDSPTTRAAENLAKPQTRAITITADDIERARQSMLFSEVGKQVAAPVGHVHLAAKIDQIKPAARTEQST